MAGHSKWATTKHKKAANDKKRSKEWAKLVKNIEVAARTGGGDPAGNPTLDDMIKKAKKASVPGDNIERARKRGAGEEEGGANWEQTTYEGYGPNGVAMLIECLTDNRNRAAAEVRTAMNKNNGNLGESGSVSYLFTRIGYVVIPKGDLEEDDVLAAVLEDGAEEVTLNGEFFEIVCQPSDVPNVRQALEKENIDVEDSGIDFRASVQVPLELEDAKKVQKLIDALEDSDDVQDVHTNMELSDEVLAELNS
ncbi:YebC/PmpR family DNA-binding transcriptional regulator [Corynebacterium yudongzhengii]|uniref:Probable transcriptional regulatory protein DF222_10885 n=1 Tax=Corynebacterium yudongzhengii TaxID=2080740 RepID=A0A2U1T458_9CORY|nr:YebC/PmpR family DNA-binding transcriptional regulator [Corynebacterium yudongzhengii]AWB81796.1 YebC/PmpR family DNA-binding transcriptional regulator [Corynebacterium yudongzhengii]PWC00787.1 YebC/PmpR family DNA-binding transcriptional regulator [Corynebacterium yudongzhengii]